MGLDNVTITIKQGDNVVATLITDSNGNANTVLNQGTYSVTFSKTGYTTTQTQITLSQNNTQILFAFPLASYGGGTGTTTIYNIGNASGAIAEGLFGTSTQQNIFNANMSMTGQ